MSSSLTWMMLGGGAVGAGVTLVVSGLSPPRPALALVIDALSRPAPPARTRSRRVDLTLATPMMRLGLPRRSTIQDLAIRERDPAQYLAQTFVLAVAALAGGGMLPLLLGLGGQLPLWVGLIGALLAVQVAQSRLRAEAERRRAQMRTTIAAMLDLVSGSLAGGAGIEQALDETLDELTGWSAVRIRRELNSAAHTRGHARVHSWTVLRDLGRSIGVDELGELATGIEQASGGAPVAETMAHISRTMRSRTVAAMERDGRSRSAKMALPIVIFGFGYLILLLYGALTAISTGLNQ
ncbi:type II secretion protein F [Micromonospora sp. WMMD1082]|uniref:type II secretion protein F n=1 Tax=Micromonospora sp. WMMD1082 TaxID=3016104 RepID=UPI00241709FC|nr:type II secretion protein F [Micromonospora sp. WMMD1082]MDG4795436.1 type II secretion protein F [Micromonospora sp. WMMD1082]